jgi:hypothetical protein
MLVKLCLVKNKLLGTPWQLACRNCQQLNINGGLELGLLHMEMRRWWSLKNIRMGMP